MDLEKYKDESHGSGQVVGNHSNSSSPDKHSKEDSEQKDNSSGTDGKNGQLI